MDHAATALAHEPLVEVVIPVYNEERDLERSVRRLHVYLESFFSFAACITVADNASTDTTPAIGARLAAELPGVRYLRLEEKGRGRALAAAWSESDADVVAYMDVDLSTGLEALLPLVAPLISGHSDLAIGSRLAAGAHVRRGPRREVISRGYNLLLRLALGVRFRDAQCGFKAIRGDVARRLVPRVQNRNWFFDTELLVLAEREGLRIHEVPVDWIDDPDSRVDIPATALEDLRGVWRLRTTRAASRTAGGDRRTPRRAVTPAGAAAPSLVALTGLAPARLAGSERHGRVHK
jgi:glycosyltransferase involved in cell wall biosynthesis